MSHIADQKKFTQQFSAEEYLKNYYRHADLGMVKRYVTEKTAAAETMRIMMHMEETCRPLIRAMFYRKKPVVLELGGGPTLYQLMNIADSAKEIHFSDYVKDNLDEIIRWKQGKSTFDWRPFFEAALMLRTDSTVITRADAKALESALKKKISKVIHCDVFAKDLGVKRKRYDIIDTHFVAESATSSRKQWEAAIGNMYRKLEKGGLLFMSALRGAKGDYKVLDKKFPAVELYESDIEAAFRRVGLKAIRISSIHTEDRSNNYEGFMFAIAQK